MYIITEHLRCCAYYRFNCLYSDVLFMLPFQVNILHSTKRFDVLDTVSVTTRYRYLTYDMTVNYLDRN